MLRKECWELWKKEDYKKKTTEYYLQEFYTGKTKKVSKKLGKKVWRLENKREKSYNETCKYDSKINRIIKRIVTGKVETI